MWLKSWKNTMGCLSPLPKITVGEEGLVNTWADLYSVVQLFQWRAHKITFEAWGLLTSPEQAQIVWAGCRAFLGVWKTLVSCRVWSRSSLLELCFQERNAVCNLGSRVKPRVKSLFYWYKCRILQCLIIHWQLKQKDSYLSAKWGFCWLRSWTKSLLWF